MAGEEGGGGDEGEGDGFGFLTDGGEESGSAGWTAVVGVNIVFHDFPIV